MDANKAPTVLQKLLPYDDGGVRTISFEAYQGMEGDLGPGDSTNADRDFTKEIGSLLPADISAKSMINTTLRLFTAQVTRFAQSISMGIQVCSTSSQGWRFISSQSWTRLAIFQRT